MRSLLIVLFLIKINIYRSHTQDSDQIIYRAVYYEDNLYLVFKNQILGMKAPVIVNNSNNYAAQTNPYYFMIEHGTENITLNEENTEYDDKVKGMHHMVSNSTSSGEPYISVFEYYNVNLDTNQTGSVQMYRLNFSKIPCYRDYKPNYREKTSKDVFELLYWFSLAKTMQLVFEGYRIIITSRGDNRQFRKAVEQNHTVKWADIDYKNKIDQYQIIMLDQKNDIYLAGCKSYDMIDYPKFWTIFNPLTTAAFTNYRTPFTRIEQIKGIHYNSQEDVYLVFQDRFVIETTKITGNLLIRGFQIHPQWYSQNTYNLSLKNSNDKPLQFAEPNIKWARNVHDQLILGFLPGEIYSIVGKNQTAYHLKRRDRSTNSQIEWAVENCLNQLLYIHDRVFCFDRLTYRMVDPITSMAFKPEQSISKLFLDAGLRYDDEMYPLEFIFSWKNNRTIFMTRIRIYLLLMDQITVDDEQGTIQFNIADQKMGIVQNCLINSLCIRDNALTPDEEKINIIESSVSTFGPGYTEFTEIFTTKPLRPVREVDTSGFNFLILLAIILLLFLIVGLYVIRKRLMARKSLAVKESLALSPSEKKNMIKSKSDSVKKISQLKTKVKSSAKDESSKMSSLKDKAGASSDKSVVSKEKPKELVKKPTSFIGSLLGVFGSTAKTGGGVKPVSKVPAFKKDKLSKTSMQSTSISISNPSATSSMNSTVRGASVISQTAVDSKDLQPVNDQLPYMATKDQNKSLTITRPRMPSEIKRKRRLD